MSEALSNPSPRCKVCIALQKLHYHRRRYQNNVCYRLECNMRARVKAAMDGRSKCARTMNLLSLTSPKFHKYLYAKSPRFAGTHYKELNVDHIVPVSQYDLSIPDHQACFHYTNCQLLTPTENMSKGCQVPEDFNFELMLRNQQNLIETIESNNL